LHETLQPFDPFFEFCQLVLLVLPLAHIPARVPFSLDRETLLKHEANVVREFPTRPLRLASQVVIQGGGETEIHRPVKFLYHCLSLLALI
jgi:hypothetical protein